ncbi:hypothetical protein ccbrp13_56170 [Ktedonobacteria bacterium brp13]|nr:hypothetical protein ccbrp13_56170 [Ktedonobacteria bacterium brp13]
MQKPGSLAEYVHLHPEGFRVAYEPVALPHLPRLKCPHQEITSVRVSDTMTAPKVSPRGCIGKPLASGWCAEHQVAQELLEIGAKLRYPEIFMGKTGARGIFCGLIHWERYAEVTSAKFLKEDVNVLRIRFDL